MSSAESGRPLPASQAAHELLESRFRRLMRWYPGEYRAEREEEMVATLMESAAPGRDRPTWRDVADLARGAVRARWRTASVPAAPRLAAQAVALPAAMLLAALLVMPVLWAAVTAYSLAGGASVTELSGGRPGGLVVTPLGHVPAILLGVALAVALLMRRPGLVRWLAAVAVPLALLTTVARDQNIGGLLDPAALTTALVAGLVAAAPAVTAPWPRRQFMVAGFWSFVLPLLAAVASFAIGIALAAHDRLAVTPAVVSGLPNMAVLVAVAAAGALAARQRAGGLGMGLLAAALAPFLWFAVVMAVPERGEQQAEVGMVSAALVAVAVVLAVLPRRSPAGVAARA